MADEYVMASEDRNFVDLDVFAAGPVVHEMSSVFDLYWNSAHAFPVQSIASSTLSADRLRQWVDEHVAHAAPLYLAEFADDGRLKSAGAGGSQVLVPQQLIPMLNLPFQLSKGQLQTLVPAKARRGV